jgi:hypothetical protein
MSAAGPVDRPHTYGDLRRWPDDVRWELIAGQAYAMTGPSWQHQTVCMNEVDWDQVFADVSAEP